MSFWERFLDEQERKRQYDPMLIFNMSKEDVDDAKELKKQIESDSPDKLPDGLEYLDFDNVLGE